MFLAPREGWLSLCVRTRNDDDMHAPRELGARTNRRRVRPQESESRDDHWRTCASTARRAGPSPGNPAARKRGAVGLPGYQAWPGRHGPPLPRRLWRPQPRAAGGGSRGTAPGVRQRRGAGGGLPGDDLPRTARRCGVRLRGRGLFLRHAVASAAGERGPLRGGAGHHAAGSGGRRPATSCGGAV